MACEYDSYSVFEQFTDAAILAAAMKRTGTDGLSVYRLEVQGTAERMNALKQAYQVEAARAALKKKGVFVTEKKAEDGKVTLTVRA